MKINMCLSINNLKIIMLGFEKEKNNYCLNSFLHNGVTEFNPSFFLVFFIKIEFIGKQRKIKEGKIFRKVFISPNM